MLPTVGIIRLFDVSSTFCPSHLPLALRCSALLCSALQLYTLLPAWIIAVCSSPKGSSSSSHQPVRGHSSTVRSLPLAGLATLPKMQSLEKEPRPLRKERTIVRSLGVARQTGPGWSHKPSALGGPHLKVGIGVIWPLASGLWPLAPAASERFHCEQPTITCAIHADGLPRPSHVREV